VRRRSGRHVNGGHGSVVPKPKPQIVSPYVQRRYNFVVSKMGQNRIRPCSQAEFAVRKKKEPHRCKTVRFTRFVSHYGRCPKAAASAALGQPTYATLHRFTSSLGKTSRVTRDPPVANTDTPSVAGLGPLPSATADEPDKALARDVAHLVTVFPAPLLGGLCRGTRTADAQDHASVDYTHCIGRNASKRLRKWQMTG
jgi:hypothetical protein